MTSTPEQVRRTYYVLGFGNTLAASLIWGVNTLFLLDAGLSNFEAFAANAFFTAGMVLFEIPTGIVADSWGRRASFLWGTITLAAGLAGSVLSLVLLPNTASVGASGAILGLAGFLLVLGYRQPGTLPPALRRGLLSTLGLTAVLGVFAFAFIDTRMHITHHSHIEQKCRDLTTQRRAMDVRDVRRGRSRFVALHC